MFVTKKEKWEEVKEGEYKAIFINVDIPFKIEEQKASIMAVYGYSKTIEVKNVKFYALNGNIQVTDSTVIALGGEIKCFGDSTVYVLSPKVKVTVYDKSTVHIVDYIDEVCSVERTTLRKISLGTTNPVIKVLTSQEEWDDIKTGEHEVILIDIKEEGEEINIDSQKAPYIVMVNGKSVVHKDVSVFVINGEIECRGGEVVAREEKNVFIKLIDGEVYQCYGNLQVYGGKFFAPKLWDLIIHTSQYEGVIGKVCKVKNHAQKSIRIG